MLGLLILLFGIVMFVSSCQENQLHGIIKSIVGEIAGEATYILISVYLMIVGLIVMGEY